MNKKTKTSVWDTEPTDNVDAVAPIPASESREETMVEKVKAKTGINLGFDMEGLMTDFPTATELQKFVYDQTGIVLNLKGRANKVKYQVALDTLNGITPSQEFIGDENPYVDRNEVIPEDPLKELPPRDPEILAAGPEVTRFGTSVFPHPDPEWRASDQKAQVVFRKYANGIITYEVLGPVAKRAVGTKINKFGNKQPEKITWIDPRTGEQIIRNANGQLTPLGTRLKGFMTRQKVNKSNQWDTWIDRDFVAADNMIIDNPWGT
jgi:hypothetical protein